MKTALVTGGAGGIGEQCCIKLANDGYFVVINYNNSKHKAEELAKKINGIAIKADLKNRIEIEKMFEKVDNKIDILVNNAGVAQQKFFDEITETEWNNIFDVNVNGTYRCCQLALPYMIHQKSGSIINISSMWGQVGASCEVAYSATKAAIIGFTKALAKELGPSNIRVNCIAPGVIDTNMNKNHSKETMDELKNETPLQRIGTPLDIAQTVAFLADEKSSFITGQIIGVNGGFII